MSPLPVLSSQAQELARNWRELEAELRIPVMSACPALQRSLYNTLVSLAVTVEQAVLGNGKFNFALVPGLLDNLPSRILGRSAGGLSGGQIFSPPSDRKSITVVLAYLRELDTVQTKGAEFVGGNPMAALTPASPALKPNATQRRKGRGEDGQSQTPMLEDEEET